MPSAPQEPQRRRPPGRGDLVGWQPGSSRKTLPEHGRTKLRSRRLTKRVVLTDPKIDILNAMYDAFGRGDVDAVLAPLADDVDWVAAPGSTAAPWFGEYHGKRDVHRFFQAIGANVDVTEFTPLSFTTNDTDVIVAIRWGYRVRATGRTTSAIMYHWWRFTGETIATARTLEDTQQAAAAFAA